MSTQSYSTAQRGGGQGETGRMRAAIVAKIDSWVQNANWEDPDRADRLLAKLHEAPERFVSPNPDATHKEEASRIYEELKEEFGLRTVRQAEREARDLEKQAERWAEKKREEHESRETEGAETAEEPEPEPEPEPETAGASQSEIESRVAEIESDTMASEPEPEPETAEPEPRPDETTDFSWRSFAGWAGRKAGAKLRSAAVTAVKLLAVLFARLAITSAYAAGRGSVALLKVSLALTVFSIKIALATVGFTFKLLLAFTAGFAAGMAA